MGSPNWTRFDALFLKYSQVFGVDRDVIKAICMNESSLGLAPSVARGLASPTDIEGSKSTDGKSWGLMQVTLTTARDMDSTATAEKLNNPDYSVKLGANYLSRMQKLYLKSDPRWLEWVVKSYNQGPGNTAKEIKGEIAGYSDEYYERFVRNLTKIRGGLL